MKVYSSIAELVGKTPLLELRAVEREFSLSAKLYAKLEGQNPAGSAKDRVAREMLAQAEREGKLSAGATVIEPTSGNTGIGLCALCAAKGYKAVIVMPDSMSQERIKLMRAYGAEVVLTDGKQGMSGAIARAEELHAQTPNSFLAGQFVNPANPQAHYQTTAPEIWADTDGKVDIFVAGVGTGGTLTGVGRYLKEQNPAVQVVAVEPKSSPVLSGGQAGAHGLQGIGAGFIPAILDTQIYDEVLPVGEAEAVQICRFLARKEGLLAGISSGAAIWAAIELAKREENAEKQIVVLLPDSGERYLSTELFED